MKDRRSRRQLFLEQMVEMISPQIKRRNMNGLQRHILYSIAVMGVQLPIPQKPPPGTQRGYCHVCDQLSQDPSKPDQENTRSSRTRVKYDRCENFVCDSHSQRKKICDFCQPPSID
ncbi:unnamed protein product [Allacma fusca]|uniref:Uncharacterized protein n=1 Tax=Allacma fusca TaxID=39272 RepID=A0A8J2PS39_9HEXA|nr:unnamed protein product [Allacma fusca]